MKLKDFKILDIFSCLFILNKNGVRIDTICNGFKYGDEIPNYQDRTNDNRTSLEKWKFYEYEEVLEIANADMDNNWENNYVEIRLNI